MMLEIGKIYVVDDPGNKNPLPKGEKVKLLDFFNPKPNKERIIESCKVSLLRNIKCGNFWYARNQTIELSNAILVAPN
jgi:hypothetical protein